MQKLWESRSLTLEQKMLVVEDVLEMECLHNEDTFFVGKNEIQLSEAFSRCLPLKVSS
jgi:hypothetical protein